MMRQILDWLDHRTGLETAVKEFMLEEIPASSGWPQVFGSMAMFFFLLQAVTGLLLSFNYAPTPGEAYNSLKFILTEVTGGRLIRGLHHWGASMMIVVVALGAYEGGLATRGAAGAAIALVLAHSTMLVAYALVARSRWGVEVRVSASVLAATFLLPMLALASLARFAGSTVIVPAAIALLGVGVFVRWGLPELRHGSLRLGAAS